MIETIPPDNNSSISFVGREAQFARLQQQILDPTTHRHALVFTGNSGVGKSAMLRQFKTIFNDPILPLYVPLSQLNFQDETSLLQYLVDGINAILEEHSFSLSRVPDAVSSDESSLHDWLRDVYLPEVMQIIRPHRRIVWLLDDAEYLKAFSPNFLTYLHELLEKESQLSIVLTINTEQEAILETLQPLVNPVYTERIHRLNKDDSVEMIRLYAPGASDDIVQQIYKATGGHPQLLARFGRILKQNWAEYGDKEAFERTKPDAYEQSRDDFRQMWSKLTRDERLVLTAIASLIYGDPTQSVIPKRIETWLVETDYMLDIVAINAALRGLDYADIITHRQDEGIHLTMGLLQQWLLEQARLDTSAQNTRGNIPLPLIAIAGLLILLLLLLIWLAPNLYIDNPSTIPTATLAS